MKKMTPDERPLGERPQKKRPLGEPMQPVVQTFTPASPDPLVLQEGGGRVPPPELRATIPGVVVGGPPRPQPGVLQRKRPERKGTKLVIVKVTRGGEGVIHQYSRCPRPRRPTQPWSNWRVT